jgi:hypothetical protein
VTQFEKFEINSCFWTVCSAINPILYTAMSIKFRRAFQRILLCGKPIANPNSILSPQLDRLARSLYKLNSTNCLNCDDSSFQFQKWNSIRGYYIYFAGESILIWNCFFRISIFLFSLEAHFSTMAKRLKYFSPNANIEFREFNRRLSQF